MIIVDDTLVSDDVKDAFFCCDLEKCKGACCIEGDAGAPLEEEEISLLEDHLDEIIPFMKPESAEIVGLNGVFDYDSEGHFVTPLVGDRECVFVYQESGIARCAIEKAFQEKAISFAKPVSCHLYPIRVKKLSSGDDALNYHKWSICKQAVEKGKREGIPLFRFLEQALIRKYGRSWYNRSRKMIEGR